MYFVLKSVFVYLCRGCVTEVGWARYYFCLFLYMYVCVYMLGGSEGLVHVWVFGFGRLDMCLCLLREGTMEGG